MNKAQLRYDVEYLAGHLVHRGASTHSERAAAEYIRDRMAVWTLNTDIDDFHTHGNTHLLFACYFAEFLVVAALAHLVPWVAFAYGCCVFLLFMTEYSGYEIMGRLLPRFDTQNVVARFMSAQPKQLFIVTAHYDTPKIGLIHAGGGARAYIVLVLCCMTVVIVSCAAQGMGVFADWEIRPDFIARWSAAFILATLAFRLVAIDSQNDYARGAQDNASGVAALLGLAQSLTERSLDRTDVWLVATGSNDAWMSGMRRLLTLEKPAKESTYFVDIDEVGCGRVALLDKVGGLFRLHTSKSLREAARTVNPKLARAVHRRGTPSDAYLALARRYEAICVTAEPEKRTPDGWDEQEDRPGRIDYDAVAQAGDLVEGIIRHFDRR